MVGLNCWTGKAYFSDINWCNQRFTIEEKGIHEDENGKMFYKTYPLENFFEENNAIVQLSDTIPEVINHPKQAYKTITNEE